MRWFIAAALTLLLIGQAHADITITNFFNNTAAGHGIVNRALKFDSTGKQLDSHASTILQWPAGTNNFYRYSEMYGCASAPVLLDSGQWCGLGVWYSPDLGADGGSGWRYLGLLFDPTSYLTQCSPLVGLDAGCWVFSMVRNVANSNFVGWFHDPGSPGTPGVVVCTPSGSGPPVPGNSNCVAQTRPTLACVGNTDTARLFVDNDATGYVIYSCVSDFHVHIDRLNSTYTDSTGSTVDTSTATSFTGEGMSLFRKGSTYFLVVQSGCPYCAGSQLDYATATSVLGTWAAGSGTPIHADTCGGQNEGLDKLTINGTDVYLIHYDLWYQGIAGQNNNQGFAIEGMEPLSISGSTISALTCPSSFTVTGITAAPQPPIVPAADVGDESSNFTVYCDITSSSQRLQTFVAPASVSSLYVRLATAQNVVCAVYAACNLVNGDLQISAVTLDGSNNPVTVLDTKRISTTDMPYYTLTPIIVQLSGPFTNGTSYGIKLAGSNTNGCWGFAYSDNLPYASGIERQSTNSGSTWSTESNRSLRFAISKTSSGLSSIGTGVH